MGQSQNIFERYEKKYLLDHIQYQLLVKQLSSRMVNDQYGVYSISNIYYDTDNFDLIRSSLKKPVYKEKLRLRSYGIAQNEDTVFLELKKKFRGVVYKRRMPMKLTEAREYLTDRTKPKHAGQIFREIDWFYNVYQPSPKVFIAYDRIAYAGKEDSELRITFDSHIRFRQSMLDLSQGDWGTQILENNQILMEIKIPGVMPIWLSHLLSSLEIFPCSFSKYGNCYQNFININIGGIICA